MPKAAGLVRCQVAMRLKGGRVPVAVYNTEDAGVELLEIGHLQQNVIDAGL